MRSRSGLPWLPLAALRMAAQSQLHIGLCPGDHVLSAQVLRPIGDFGAGTVSWTTAA